eukprot:scaffold8747_cov78-Skeletonema_dohrnii-CCMP3373.AAC.1
MACTECHCVVKNEDGSCERCVRNKNLKCNPHRSRHGKITDLIPEESPPHNSVQQLFPSKRAEPNFAGDVESIDEEYEVLDVHCHGFRGLWSISDSTTLSYQSISSRVTMPKEGITTFIANTSVAKLPQGANGVFAVFRKKKSDSWHLAVIESFFYLNHDGTDKIHLFEWTGPLASSFGSAAFHSAITWDDLHPHFTRRMFELEEIDLFFVNQVRGNTFPNHTIPDVTRSDKDGGIQCHPDGPDVVPPSIVVPVEREGRNMNVNLQTLATPKGIHPFLLPNTMEATLRQRSRKRKSQKQQSDLSKRWIKPPKKLPSDESTVCAIFVSNTAGDTLTPEELAGHGDASNLFFFPSPCCPDGQKSNLQQFYGIPSSKYNTVVDEIDGLSPEEARCVLDNHCESSHILCNATSLHPQDSIHCYTKIFATSDSCPSPPTSLLETRTINLPTLDRKITYTLSPARNFYQFIPLSVGVIDPTLHGLNVTSHILRRIALALGKNGIFGRRSRSRHKGSLSFIGRRSFKTVAQPSPNEGEANSFWYFRKHINMLWWPLVLKVVNKLIQSLLVFPRIEFFHLTRLLPYLLPEVFCNGMLDFCLFSIITIDFVNTIHTDSRDTLGEYADERALKGLEELQSCSCLSPSQQQQVTSSIEHIKRFGLGTATTCGYQIVVDERVRDSNVKVLQYFSCFGAGVCYEVKDYFTHTFLPATFSHYTSAPLFIHNGLVYSEFNGFSIMAWGKGEVKERGSYRPIVSGRRVRRSQRNRS